VSILDRILLILLALSGICAGFIAILAGSGWGASIGTSVAQSTAFYPENVVTIVIGVVLVIIALRFFFYRLRAREAQYVVLDGLHGQIRISYETIRQLANRSAKSIRGVQEFDTRVRSLPTGIALMMRVRVLPDVELAQMSADIQSSVKAYIEQTTGVHVEQVVVNVTELAGNVSKTAKAWVD